MALSFACVTPQGFDVSNCYARVESVQLPSTTEVHFRLVYYKDSTQPVSFKTEDGYMCAYDLSGGNPIEQAYAYLKTLDQFKNAVDV